MSNVNDKYDDIKAEWLTLQQTNSEYKRTLSLKVKENMRLQQELELQRKKHELD